MNTVTGAPLNNPNSLNGIGAAEGIAIGPVYVYTPFEIVLQDRTLGTIDQEWDLFQNACQSARQELELIKAGLDAHNKTDMAAIFDAHITLTDDLALTNGVKQRLKKGLSAEKALSETIDEMASVLERMDNQLFAARGADMRDVGRRILRNLLGLPDVSFDNIQSPSIVVANELTPGDIAKLQLRPSKFLGFCTAMGGLTAHISILARTLGIPAVVGIGKEAYEEIRKAKYLVLNGTTGEVFLNPDPGTVESFRKLQEEMSNNQAELQLQAAVDAQTADGKHINVGANIMDLDSAKEAVRNGAQGVGLFRTEFLFLDRKSPPSEEEQVEVYNKYFAIFGERPIIIRTLDVGGDKPPSYLKSPPEQNPFLGWRGIRVCLDEIELFKMQLRAILRAATGYEVLIMFPMIGSVDELRWSKKILDEAKTELRTEGKTFSDKVSIGIMVETPAAVTIADLLAEECEFLSLGTNDLTQYMLAVDRTNERVGNLYQQLHPAVLRAIKATIDAGHSCGKWVGMCGEMAGMKKAIPVLLGMGLDEFSMVPRLIPEAKWLMRQLTQKQFEEIAEQSLRLKTAQEVDEFLSGVLSELKNANSV